MALGAISTAVSLAFNHLDSVDNGTVITMLKGVAMCLIFPGVLCSAMLTNMHDPSVIVSALCNLPIYILLGIITNAIVRVYRKNASR